MPQFDISTYSSQIFWLLLIFGIIYSFVKHFVVPKAEAIITKREGFFDNYQQSITELQANITELKERYELGIKEVKGAVAQIQIGYEAHLNDQLTQKQQALQKECQQQSVIAEKQVQEIISKFKADKNNIRYELSLVVLAKLFNNLPFDNKILASCNQTMN